MAALVLVLRRHLLTSDMRTEVRMAKDGDTFVGLGVRTGKNLNEFTYWP